MVVLNPNSTLQWLRAHRPITCFECKWNSEILLESFLIQRDKENSISFEDIESRCAMMEILEEILRNKLRFRLESLNMKRMALTSKGYQWWHFLPYRIHSDDDENVKVLTWWRWRNIYCCLCSWSFFLGYWRECEARWKVGGDDDDERWRLMKVLRMKNIRGC